MRTMYDMMKMLKYLDRERDRMVGRSHCEINFTIFNHDTQWKYVPEQEWTSYECPHIERISFGTFRWEMEKKTVQEYLDDLAAFLFDKSMVFKVVDCSYDVSTCSRTLDYYSHITRLEFALEPSDDGQTNIDADFIEILLKLLKPKFRI